MSVASSMQMPSKWRNCGLSVAAPSDGAGREPAGSMPRILDSSQPFWPWTAWLQRRESAMWRASRGRSRRRSEACLARRRPPQRMCRGSRSEGTQGGTSLATGSAAHAWHTSPAMRSRRAPEWRTGHAEIAKGCVEPRNSRHDSRDGVRRGSRGTAAQRGETSSANGGVQDAANTNLSQPIGASTATPRLAASHA